MIIDIHSHILTREYIDSFIGDVGAQVEKKETGQVYLNIDGLTQLWYRDTFFNVEERLARMDENGVTAQFLSLSAPNVYSWKPEQQIDIARKSNDAIAAMCRDFPGRFYGFASLPLGDVKASLLEIDRAIDGLGLSGIAIGSNVAGVTLDDARFEPIWARLNATKTPVFEHPMFPTQTPELEGFMLPIRVGFPYDTTTAMTRLIYSGVLQRYPDFPFIVAHTGGALLMLLQRLDNGYHIFPECREFIDELPSAFAKRLYYDTASFYSPAIEMALKIVGPDQLLWGSDEPFLGAKTSCVDDLDICDEDKSKILGGNAQRIFGIGP